MCGITGLYSASKLSINDSIKKMCLAINHRGPDDSNFWQDTDLGITLGHQRLSILDLTNAGQQPMKSSSGQFITTYNGEIYNHFEIRKELEQINSNIKWRGTSDTETLIEAIQIWGLKKTLTKIEGMFAFVICDRKNGSLTLVRDRMGEKPLYYGWQGKGMKNIFLFASELKALKKHPEFIGEINHTAINLQLRHDYIPDPYSIYKNIYKLLPGHYLELTRKDLEKGLLPAPKLYWSLTEAAIIGHKNQINLSDEDLQNNLETYLLKSVKKQMISDVPLGAFLSGGIDSSTIVSLMQSQSNQPVKTFTIGYNENDYNEAKYSKNIAEYLHTDHTELYVSSENALNIIPKLSTIYDEPFSDTSQIPTFIVSQLAKKHVKVALTGDGGDELFCGYKRYALNKKYWDIFRLMPQIFRKMFGFGIEVILPNYQKEEFSSFSSNLNAYPYLRDKLYKGRNLLNSKTFNDFYNVLFSHWQNLPGDLINNENSIINSSKINTKIKRFNIQEQMMIIDLLNYLPCNNLVKIDRAAMASSLETRVPFLDHKFIEYVWKIPHSHKFNNGEGKRVLKKILNKYIPKNLTERPKMGFGIPIGSWLRGPLKDWAENLLDEKKISQEGYINPKLITYKWKEHLSGKKNWQYDLWNVLMFQAWNDENKN